MVRNLIPFRKLSKEEASDYGLVMAKGNGYLKNAAKLVGMEHKTFRARLFKKAFDIRDWPEIHEDQISEFIQAIPYIQSVRNIEFKVLCGYSALARKLAKSFKDLDLEDATQEALSALLDAIYSYDKPTIKFATYAWWVIRNRMLSAVNQNHAFCPLSNIALKLIRQFEKASALFNGPLNQERIIDSMNLNDENRKILVDSLNAKIVNAKELFQNADGFDGDYTQIRTGIDNEDIALPNYEVMEALKKADLTPFQRMLIEKQITEPHGWQVEFARSTICASTGKPYTRQRINQIINEGLKQVKTVYCRGNQC